MFCTLQWYRPVYQDIDIAKVEYLHISIKLWVD